MNTIRTLALTLSALFVAAAAAADRAPSAVSRGAIELDAKLAWKNARLIAVQDAGRNKTLHSFASEAMTAMTGKDRLPGLSPDASLFEWLFNSRAYADEPVIYIKDKGLRIEFSMHLPATDRQYVVEKGYMTPRQLADQKVQQRIGELEPRFEMVTAIRRVRDAQVVAFNLDRMLNIVPAAAGPVDSAWHTPGELIDNLPADLARSMGAGAARNPVPGITPEQATSILDPWAVLRSAWLAGDASRAQTSLDRLAAVLPTVAMPGVYPTESQRAAEARYYAMGKFTWGWVIYFFGALAGFWALVTRWKTPWLIGFIFLALAVVLHAYGLGLRWYILGRIPVANMFEAVVGSAWIGIALAMLLELRFRRAIFLFAANVCGFLGLILGSYVIPGGGTLTTIMGILDDVMLRIHTVLIIASYALIFVASVIAVVYLFSYYFRRALMPSISLGAMTAVAGLGLWAVAEVAFQTHGGGVIAFKPPALFWASAGLLVILASMITWLALRSGATPSLGATILGAIAVTIIFVGNQQFVRGSGISLLAAGGVWALLNALGMVMGRVQFGPRPALAGGAFTDAPVAGRSLTMERPILAGGAPGDEARVSDLPKWLQEIDWCHLIILNMVFVMLFVGIILGAVWADYSWGRPWGWDPKEVFALNTWIIYAMLIHARFIVKDRGLWTAWLSVIGCLMMAFNWCFVNFFIVGLHSYA
ncbi:MAG: hypothetical protein AMXMBFR47_37540 [Planctomycetota bacterium]